MIKVITGKNSYGRVEALKKLVAGFVAEHGDMALEKIDGEESSYDRIRESLESMPFLASKKLVVLRSPSKQKEFQEKAKDLLENIPDSTDVVIYEPDLDKRTSYAKYLKKQEGYQEFNELDANGLAGWLVETADKRGAKLSRTDANMLVNRIGPKQQMLHGELGKLISSGKTINKKLIGELVESVPQSTIFDLLDSAFSGNHKKMLEIYNEQRIQNVEPQAMIGLIVWQLHVLTVCVWAEGRGAGQIASESKISPYVLRKSIGISSNLTKQKVKKMLSDLLDLDQAIKTSSINADDALQAYLLGI
jgi:DNA polymerase-3 subunit delta